MWLWFGWFSILFFVKSYSTKLTFFKISIGPSKTCRVWSFYSGLLFSFDQFLEENFETENWFRIIIELLLTGGQALDSFSFKNQDDRPDSSIESSSFQDFESLKRGSRKVVFQFEVEVMRVCIDVSLPSEMNLNSLIQYKLYRLN